MSDGRSAGVVSLDQARYLAREHNLDLVEISSTNDPPIVKLLDYNKYRYQQEKLARQAQVNRKNNQLKEMRLSFSIDEHDLETKANRAREFLAEGHFVRVFIKLRGRENVFPGKAKQILFDFQNRVGGAEEQPVSQVANKVQLTMKPKKGHAKTEN